MFLLLFDLLLFQLHLTVVYDLAYVRKCPLGYFFCKPVCILKELNGTGIICEGLG